MASEPSGPRAAQIQAVREVLQQYFGEPDGPHGGPAYDQAAAELVDAVHAAGRDGQDEVERLRAELVAMTDLHDAKHRDWQDADNARQKLLVERANLRADLQRADQGERERHRAQDAVMVEALTQIRRLVGDLPEGVQRAITIAASRIEDLAHAHGQADGWAEAVQALRDEPRYFAWCDANPRYDGRRVWSLSARHGLADYLEAVGPDGTAGRGGVTHLCPPDATGIMPCCRRPVMEAPKTDRITTEAERVTCTAAETGQDGAGVDAGCGEAETGGGEARG